VLNNPSKLIDPTGLEANDPQEPKKKEDPKPPENPLPNVTVTISTAEGTTDGTLPLANIPLEKNKYATGVVAPLTITVTDESGNPLEGLTIKETNKVIEAEPNLKFEQNPTIATTDANGSITDVVFGNATISSDKVSRQEARDIINKQVETRVKVVTEQTLEISDKDKNLIATAVYRRTITNLDARGNRRPATNSLGGHVNNFSISVTPVTVSRPKSP
jgi:hypothetical protein